MNEWTLVLIAVAFVAGIWTGARFAALLLTSARNRSKQVEPAEQLLVVLDVLRALNKQQKLGRGKRGAKKHHPL